MWTNTNLKTNAKVAFKRNYWKCVLVALLLGIATGAGNAGTSAANTYNETQNLMMDDYYSDEYYDDYYEEDNLDDYYEEDYYEDDMFSGSFVLSGLFNAFSTTVLVIVALIGVVLAFAIQYFVLGPLEVGCCNFFKNNAHEKAELDKVTFGFKKSNYFRMASTMFLRNLYIVLWTLLLIVPGIIKAYEYRMVTYILTDCPDMSRKDAFRISKEMMHGNKWKAFVLDLSFLGWSILATATCGIVGLFYVSPYVAATDAELFIAIREEYFKKQRG